MPQLSCEPFVTVDDVLEATCACDLTEEDHGDLIVQYIDDASDALYVLSGGRVFGRCTRTVWPIRKPGWCEPDRQAWIGWDGADSIPLMGPEIDVLEITIDGGVIAPTEYGLLDNYKLFRRNGQWPENNDVTLFDTEPGTFTITYSFGRHPNLSQRRAAIELVCQMVKGDLGTLTRMRGVISANVQGVQVQMDEDEVRSLGLPEVNKFMDIYGANGVGALGVYSPELNHGWRLVTVSDATLTS